ncbi:hypothetical protein SAMN05660284_01022 [Formivibrio citricus]|uniref:Tryptophan synthase subunit beta like protein n=1 Tax=Formivibrio citricus TaxID=83765 RepID=A0A1I4XIE9_9NEIS|nr:hypothetical protein [Formivibrio citricus]SFN25030.1 hypothetical protein SAMN05660284_01022 [Formivibrio citricus]
MPYVRRNSEGQITALFHHSEPDAQEFLPQHSPEIARFLGVPADSRLFTGLDEELIRVVEDLIDVLITKNILRLTDLPLPAQEKLLSRKRLRQELAQPQSTSFLDSDDGLL